jgi:hypothetical protein
MCCSLKVQEGGEVQGRDEKDGNCASCMNYVLMVVALVEFRGVSFFDQRFGVGHLMPV